MAFAVQQQRHFTDRVALSDNLWGSGDDGSFTLPSNTRHSLSSILIVHPIAALMTGICTVLAFCSHFQGPSHSPRYLLALLILSFPTLLITLLAFLVDILLFIPHMAWGGWIVLAATILITLNSLLTCAMRRTLVSRKARKKRIAENAEMNGQTYFETRQEQQFARVDSPPPLNDRPANGVAPKPQFATFEYKRKPSQEDRVPLNAPQSPSPESMSTTGRGNATAPTGGPAVVTNGVNMPLVPMVMGNPPGREVRRKNMRSPPDSPIDGQRRSSSPSTMLNREFSEPRMGAPGGGGPGPNGRVGGQRGRGYPPRGGMPPRGGYPPRGSYGRGGPQGMRGPPPPGWNGNSRGGYPPGPNRGGPVMRGRGGPPPGYPNRPNNGYPSGPSMRMDGRQPPPGLYGPMPAGPFNRGPPAAFRGAHLRNESGYLSDIPQSPNDEHINGILPDMGAPMEEYAPGRVISMYSQPGGVNGAHDQANGVDQAPRELDGQHGDSQPLEPLAFIFGDPRTTAPHDEIELPGNTAPGQAVELDATTGVPVEELARNESSQRAPTSPVEMGDSSSILHRHQSPTHTIQPIELPTSHNTSQPASPIDAAQQHDSIVHPALRTHSRTASDSYYEDVDPRFASDNPPLASPSTIGPLAGDLQPHASSAPRTLTSPLVPGYIARQRHLTPSSSDAPPPLAMPATFYPDPNAPLDVDADAEDAASRARSPAASETSNFTSVSQRGVNPNWRPIGGGGHGASIYGGGGSQYTARGGRWKGEASSSLSILEGNPDFTLPGVGAGPRARMGMGMGSGVGMTRGGPPPPVRGSMGLGLGRQGAATAGVPGAGMLGVSRYPTDV